MRHKKKQKENDLSKYRVWQQIQTKLLVRTALIFLAAVLAICTLYSHVLQGHIAVVAIRILQVFFKDYDTAFQVYEQTFRRYMDLFLLAGIGLVCLFFLRLYLHVFTRYFQEIYDALDALLFGQERKIAISPELAPLEKKLYSIRHTLEQQTLAAQAAEKQKNDLVVYLAHDLRTPLTSVIGYLTLLREETQISDELRQKYLTVAAKKADRLEELLDEFFELTRYNFSDLTLAYQTVNLNRWLDQLVFEFQPMLMEKKLICTLELPLDTMISCDVDQMQRVFDNLLKNAVSYSHENGEICICVFAQQEKLHIIFSNTGDVIPPEQLTRMFEQFYRLDTARRGTNGGAGLGLAIAKQIVEMHKGTITAKSEAGRVIFEVVLPESEICACE